jgi:hypothetical protein
MAPTGRQLRGWKEIAAHLGVSERTAKRWEGARSLPVHRVPGTSRDVVLANADELASWLAARTAGVGAPDVQVKDVGDGNRLDRGDLPPATSAHGPADEAPAGPDELPAGNELLAYPAADATRLVGRRMPPASRRRVVIVRGSLVLILAVLVGWLSGDERRTRHTRRGQTSAAWHGGTLVTLSVGDRGAWFATVGVRLGECAQLELPGGPPLELCPRAQGDVLLITARDASSARSVTVEVKADAEVRVLDPVPFHLRWETVFRGSPRVPTARRRYLQATKEEG